MKTNGRVVVGSRGRGGRIFLCDASVGKFIKDPW